VTLARARLARARLARAALLTGGLLAAALMGCGAPRYRGPRTAHFDGHAFANLAPFDARGFWDFVAWQLSDGAKPWPDWVDVASTRPAERVAQGAAITVVNHATVLVQLGGVNILTDPVWSDSVGPAPWIGFVRHKAPGIAFDDLPPIDAVVISHNHYDHLDLPTLVRLAERHHPVFVAGLGTARLLAESGVRHAIDLDWWQALDVDGVKITFAPAQHWSRRGLDDANGILWGSFLLEAGGTSVYFAGDTAAGPHFAAIRRRLGAPDIALLPIGAYEPRWFMRPQHMSPAEAADAHLALGARRSVAVHWGTFDLSDEGIDDPPRALHAALRERRIPPQRFLALDNGEACAPCAW
jgi:L-ascorbate metabolism protein UlaG (beta-lactamase superfamily)